MNGTNLADFVQTQLRFKVGAVGGAAFSSPGTVTYKIEPKEDGWSVEHKDANDMRATPFTTCDKEKWTTEELKKFFQEKDFSCLDQAKAFKSQDESLNITSKEQFLALLN